MNSNTNITNHPTTSSVAAVVTTSSSHVNSLGQMTVGVVGNNGNNIIDQQKQNQNSSKQIGKIAQNAGYENGSSALPTMTTNNKNFESGKRKKSKSRSSNNNNNQLNLSLPKSHLDAWLETCLKDSAAPQLSSSSEFLDYNQSSFNLNNKKPSVQQQFFTKTTYPAPFSQGFQKTIPNNHNLLSNPFYFNNFIRNTHHNTTDEFTSLPPIVNLTTVGENIDNNLDINDPTRNFRFSDPCLLNPSDGESKMSGQNTPNDNVTNLNNNKLFMTLMEQINLLHETNSKICRNLQDTKIDIEALKNSPNWGLRHRRDSLSGLSTHSQPMGFAFGTQSPAPTYHSGMYTPGMMTDVVREVKEAARVREDALLSRVKSMVEERSWTVGEGNLRMMRDIEELKSQIQHLRSDRKDCNKRITQLEAENKYMKQLLTSLLNNKTNEIIHEHEYARSTPINRKNSTEILTNSVNNRPKRHSFNLHYGVINHNDESTVLSSFGSPNDRKSTSFDNTKLETAQNQTMNHRKNYQNHLNGLKHTQSSVPDQYNSQLRIIENQYSTSNLPPLPLESSCDLAGLTNVSTNDDSEQNVLQMEKDTIELRRELQEALASKKDAENRIIALENVVKKLQIFDEKQNINIKQIGDNVGGGGNDSVGNNGGGSGLVVDRDQGSRGHGHTNFINGSTSSTQRLLNNNGDMYHLNNSVNHITSPMQGITSKFSLAGPITDL